MACTKVLISLALAAGTVAFTGCVPSMKSGLDQAGGNAPLVIDLDEAGTPFVVASLSSAGEVTATVRGPSKGAGERGGISGTFIGNGGDYCVIMDPANVWEGPTPPTPDAALDDGDSDLFVGRASDYSGTPGVRIGEFQADYIDNLGVPHTIDENLCQQFDLNGLPGAHGGAAAPEFCHIPSTEVGVPYVVLAETISVAPSSQTLKVAFRVNTGTCPQTVDETTLTGDN